MSIFMLILGHIWGSHRCLRVLGGCLCSKFYLLACLRLAMYSQSCSDRWLSIGVLRVILYIDDGFCVGSTAVECIVYVVCFQFMLWYCWMVMAKIPGGSPHSLSQCAVLSDLGGRCVVRLRWSMLPDLGGRCCPTSVGEQKKYSCGWCLAGRTGMYVSS